MTVLPKPAVGDLLGCPRCPAIVGTVVAVDTYSGEGGIEITRRGAVNCDTDCVCQCHDVARKYLRP